MFRSGTFAPDEEQAGHNDNRDSEPFGGGRKITEQSVAEHGCGDDLEILEWRQQRQRSQSEGPNDQEVHVAGYRAEQQQKDQAEHGGGQGTLELRDTGAGAAKEDRTPAQRAAKAGDSLP